MVNLRTLFRVEGNPVNDLFPSFTNVELDPKVLNYLPVFYHNHLINREEA